MDNADAMPDACKAARDRLPVLTRIVFEAHRDQGLSYVEIAERLSVDGRVVEACVAEALSMMAMMLDGQPPVRTWASIIEPVEHALILRHRAYCRERLTQLGIAAGYALEEADYHTRALGCVLKAMPRRDLDVFLLNRLDGLTYKEIARRLWTFKRVIMRRMLLAIQFIMKGPRGYARWLDELLRETR